ncbi:uncharacterized protein VTP21DRAFT_5958 [Calcarisporiella thermophila]|uniref:uncharacterized protein n=1 Tax=Calcarisporiella thermophila TaxID=911321 RepID=UPI003743D3DC
MQAREGRNKQVYSNGSRIVSGCVPIHPITGHVLLISSRKAPSTWVLPKGGWENDESIESAAIRETYEEAGVRGRISCHLGIWPHTKMISTGAPRAIFYWYELEVVDIEDHWPEENQRQRKWFPLHEAIELVTKPFIREALEACKARYQLEHSS